MERYLCGGIWVSVRRELEGIEGQSSHESGAWNLPEMLDTHLQWTIIAHRVSVALQMRFIYFC